MKRVPPTETRKVQRVLQYHYRENQKTLTDETPVHSNNSLRMLIDKSITRALLEQSLWNKQSESTEAHYPELSQHLLLGSNKLPIHQQAIVVSSKSHSVRRSIYSRSLEEECSAKISRSLLSRKRIKRGEATNYRSVSTPHPHCQCMRKKEHLNFRP